MFLVIDLIHQKESLLYLKSSTLLFLSGSSQSYGYEFQNRRQKQQVLNQQYNVTISTQKDQRFPQGQKFRFLSAIKRTCHEPQHTKPMIRGGVLPLDTNHFRLNQNGKLLIVSIPAIFEVTTLYETMCQNVTSM